jgi:hypothetical protein
MGRKDAIVKAAALGPLSGCVDNLFLKLIQEKVIFNLRRGSL